MYGLSPRAPLSGGDTDLQQDITVQQVLVQQEEELASSLSEASNKVKKHATKPIQARDAYGSRGLSKEGALTKFVGIDACGDGMV